MAEGTDRAGHRVANDIARRIIHIGWPIGQHLGTEAALLTELGVGRSTFREGISILKRQGIVRSEAGPRGGLVIEAPPGTALSNLLRNYLELADVSFQELMLVHRILAHVAADLALARVTPARLNDLRAALRMPMPGRASRDDQGMLITGFEGAMLRLADNPDLEHVTLALHRLLADFGHQERYPKALWSDTLARNFEINEQMLSALVARDPALHDIIDKRYGYVLSLVAELEGRNARIWNRRSFLHGAYTSAFVGRESSQRAPLRVSYELAAEIRRKELAPGTRLGNELEIARRHGASRVVTIEALRMLEFLGIVRVLRGRSVGVEVIAPDPTLVIQTAALYLEYLDGLPTDLHILRRGLERGLIEAASDHLCDSRISPLAARAAAFDHIPFDERCLKAAALYRDLIALANNRAATFLAEILERVHRKRRSAGASSSVHIVEAGKALQIALSSPDGLDVPTRIMELLIAVDEFSSEQDIDIHQ
ncbi:MAG TPA: GntR family transcriptional regulator [Sphingobium sp.]|uniref:FadR/GntR family transcriptional regulator n=1 Tax=Sphingobium sp. TaxID=1912891 RepID=UPI002ED0F3DF